MHLAGKLKTDSATTRVNTEGRNVNEVLEEEGGLCCTTLACVLMRLHALDLADATISQVTTPLVQLHPNLDTARCMSRRTAARLALANAALP